MGSGYPLSAVLGLSIGHGLMLEPLSRNALDGINSMGGSMWFSQGCSIGCTSCNDTGLPVPPGFPNTQADLDESVSRGLPNIGSYNGDLCPNDHSKMGAWKTATLTDPRYTTMNAQSGPGADESNCLASAPDPSLCGNWSAWNPWRAPGSTPGFDPCGMAGGAHTNMSMRAGGFGPQTGYPQGFEGSKLPPVPRAQRKIWKAGGVADVSWVSVANHAGGYQWSLCAAGSGQLTEECFEATPLQFANLTHQRLRYMYLKNNGTITNNHTEVTVPAVRVTEGVHPAGSTWTKNPVPAGSWTNGKPGTGWAGNQHPPQFPPPEGCDDHCWGYQPCNVGFTHPSYEGWNRTQPLPPCANGENGEGCCHTTAYLAVIDEVVVPKVPPGDYVVRWRWDCEQSPQIWSGCADVVIE